MENIFKFLLFGSILAIVASCNDSIEDYSTVDLPDKGAVVAVSNVVGGFFDLYDIDNTAISFDIEAKGEAVNSIEVYKSFNGGEPVFHSSVSEGNMTFSLVDALNGTSIDVDDLVAGDQFVLSFKPTTPTSTYRSGGTLLIDMSCPSDLITGEYTLETTGTSTDGCCGTNTINSEVTLVNDGNGSYTISDFSAGLYFTWYSVYGISEAMQTSGDLNGTFKDVCGELSGEFSEIFGSSVTLTGNADINSGVITYTWTNGFGDTGDVVMTPK